ncbi:hypothetical protein D8674_012494 [Pyrus ussuriensis x Pyrus communis]|uniref:Uncharacterized protein n=1 Tax=Pyrus ussuriensis x Pyrus communis TaxID=2448454 RepID=A0A5N5G1S7_9ROSA|nr:hypothetical protein D8674_012494 [Pyrus ussuriensis x Pyrus communis]
MSLTTGVPKGSSWQPNMTADTTTPSYWLNWRVLLCTVWISIAMTLSVFVVCKYEARTGISNRGSGGETQQQTPAGSLFEDETWRPCLKGIHPAWLLAFRVFAFFVLLILLVVTTFVDGGSIFLFYTQWTFTLITIYFGLGSLLSIQGCYRYHKKTAGDRVDSFEVDTEQGSTRATPSHVVSCSTSTAEKSSAPHVEQPQPRQPAGFSGYVFQIIFQMNAGAVLLTDSVFWFILVPFLAIKDYNLNFFIVNMHTINAVFLLGDTALNSLPFPWFRIGYFFLWTVFYVVFQWLFHACVKFWWPYPFLDLSSPYAPVWYLSVGLLHIPCYSIFALIMKLKHHLFSTWWPESYQCAR